ncbi:MAG: nucleotidyltransferase substrate binding protein [Planctomycetaceae bacterium]|jgi:hypothetical protein|nr:nucleotidyltransferase substrate binding protein [Planctomycetaceae bacterium]
MEKRNSDKLAKAIRALEDAIKYSRSGEFQGLNIEFKSVLIASVVQNFNLTLRVCRQMIALQLSEQVGPQAVTGKTPQEMFRSAAGEGIIGNLSHWLEYLECEHLSQTSQVALRTFEKASAFVADAGELLRTCTRRLENERRRAA